MNGVYDIYCKTTADRCRPDPVYLGKLPANTKARCPVCGRWSYYSPPKKAKKPEPIKSPTVDIREVIRDGIFI